MIDRLLDDLHEWLNGRSPGQVSRSLRGTEIQLLVDEIEELRRMASNNCVDAIKRCVDEIRQAKVDVAEDAKSRSRRSVAKSPARSRLAKKKSEPYAFVTKIDEQQKTITLNSPRKPAKKVAKKAAKRAVKKVAKRMARK